MRLESSHVTDDMRVMTSNHVDDMTTSKSINNDMVAHNPGLKYTLYSVNARRRELLDEPRGHSSHAPPSYTPSYTPAYTPTPKVIDGGRKRYMRDS